jgi:hypothetical protein
MPLECKHGSHRTREFEGNKRTEPRYEDLSPGRGYEGVREACARRKVRGPRGVDADRCQPPRRAFSGLRNQRDPGSDAEIIS